MRPQFLGDSYDLVKRSLIAALADLGPWSVHPMFTEDVSSHEAELFAALVGVPLVSTAKLSVSSDRKAYLSSCLAARNLFLDPDTGIRVEPIRSKRAPEYVFGPELAWLAEARRDCLTMVYDQSLPRGAENEHLSGKVAYFGRQGFSAFAYHSHASFVILSSSHELVTLARQAFHATLKIPEFRLYVGAV